jgi:hypothetical protein
VLPATVARRIRFSRLEFCFEVSIMATVSTVRPSRSLSCKGGASLRAPTIRQAVIARATEDPAASIKGSLAAN